MSNEYNDMAKDNILDDVLEPLMSSAELVEELGIEVVFTPTLTLEAVMTKAIAANYKIKSVLTHDELVDMVVEKRFTELPEPY
jgi:hypothetical protein